MTMTKVKMLGHQPKMPTLPIGLASRAGDRAKGCA